MVALDDSGGTQSGFNDVGGKWCLAKKSTAPIFFASSSKTRMNSSPMIFRFRSGSVTPASFCKAGLCIHMDKMNFPTSENSIHFCAFVFPHQTVVHKNTGELLADGPLEQCRHHRAVYAAGEASSTLPLPTFSRTAFMVSLQ